MKTILALMICGATLIAAKPVELTPENLKAALDFAESAWGYHISDPIHLQPERLNPCVLNKDEAAVITVLTKTSATLLDGVRTELPATYEYIVRVNSNCHWTQPWLDQVMSHEFGHILIGASFHSPNPRSIMYRITKPSGQCVLEEDRKLVVRFN